MKNLGALLPLALIVVLFWLFIIRPASRRQKALSATQASVEIGAEVMLGSGFYGTVVSVADDTLQLEVAPGTHVKVARQAVVRVVNEPVGREVETDAEAVEPITPVKPADDQD